MDLEFTKFLAQFISDHKNDLMLKVLNERTKYLTIVLEDIFQPHNASAVLRSCDCMGVQDVHIIENKNKYELNPNIELGAAKWLNLKKYNKLEHNTADCLIELKQNGYRIVATSPHQGSYTIMDLPINNKIALVMGTEMSGISNVVEEMADDFVLIPMYGFTESLNISVSTAICLYELTKRIRESEYDWKLSEVERQGIYQKWLKGQLKKADAIEREYYRKNEEK
jgi:tRNA (guanosine-2'-O-)-methyltransferase